MPTVDQLQGDLDLDFEAAWTEMIKVAAAGLDPTGELGVANRLRKHLVDNPQLRSDTKKEYDDLLKNDLPKTLENVKSTLVDQQREQLIEALKNVVSSDMPGQQRVCDSMTDREPATKALTTEVVQRIPEELRATVLIESFAALSDEADKVVSDGVTQLEEQSQTLETKPDAISMPAIEKELEGRLKKAADGQRAQRTGEPLRPSYDVFTRVNEAVPAKTRNWFDQRVSDVGNRVWEKVAPGNVNSRPKTKRLFAN